MTDEQSTVTFKLPKTLRDKIKAMAAFEDRSESSMIRRLLGEALSVETTDNDEEGEQ